MDSPIAPEWAGAAWVGEIDLADLRAVDAGSAIALVDAEGYRWARLLVRAGRTPVGFVEVPVVDGAVRAADVQGGLDADAVDRATNVIELSEVRAAADPLDITVVICTRDRADLLRGALRSVLALGYPTFDVLVVDNAPSTDATRALVMDEFDDPRLRYVVEPVPGLSSARNTGLLAATGTVVAFTDDDVVVDGRWLEGVAAGFARADDVVCVTGLVPSGELRTRTQRFFDDRVSWSRNLAPRVFRLAEQPDDLPMFPFSVGAFGTGANVSVRRAETIAMGGFDTAFGVGTRTGGGEDLDVFTRVLFAGHALVVEPSALVWHRHRDDLGGLRVQAVGYGTGLGAWLTKIALQPRTLGMALVRAPRAARHLLGGGAQGGGAQGGAAKGGAAQGGATGNDAVADDPRFAAEVSRVRWTELRSVVRGPWRYLRQRRDGAGLLDPTTRPVQPPTTRSTAPAPTTTTGGLR
jgi:GT2 family glycosyltransferase